MALPETIARLVDRFHQNREAYLSGQYNETQVRREFIDPMFTCLGWDVENRNGYAEAYKDVIHEDAIKVGGVTKAPDYCFRIGGTRKFFLEAKKPAIRIRDDISPAYQLRRYAWSAKLPLSVLTDFEEFALYDCRVRPTHGDSPATARVMFLNYADYEQRWDHIESVLSRDAVLKGSFDKYADSTKAKRGTAEVDAEFLKEIEAWRESLARNIALRNPQLDQRALNTAVQQTIDRIVFLRLCEDRGIEEYGRLQQHLNGDNVYARILKLFHEADERYNSGLFHFRPEKDRPDHDRLTTSLKIDDNTIKDIISRLYYPESPYEFSVLPADILGQVYEQFLGKVIRLTKSHQAKVEEKPEVRKAGGVYYTPTYIVDYIVKNTVGKLLENKSPKNIDGSVGSRSRATAPPLRILDPACGSGSFLINAYQFLLDWYRDQYAKDPEKYAKGRNPRIYQRAHNDYALTVNERKRILTDHIYGVDIDPQAVEVTKLSLLLKVLEGENNLSIQNQLNLFHQRALPDLNQNIKCGNSLIGPDFYNGKQTTLFNEDEIYRINAFDWSTEFPFLTKDSGFDAVIGNPPYIRIQTMKEWVPSEVEAYKATFRTAAVGNYDIYVLFVERSLRLLALSGLLAFILPNKFFVTDYGAPLRSLISEISALDRIVCFRHHQIFKNATNYTCLLFLSNSPSQEFSYANVDTPRQNLTKDICFSIFPSAEFTSQPWSFAQKTEKSLAEKISHISTPLGAIPVQISRGSSTGNDHIFILRKDNNLLVTQDSQPVDIEPEILRAVLYATSFSRYRFTPDSSEVIIFPYDINESGYKIKPESDLKRDFPKTYRYLCQHKAELQVASSFTCGTDSARRGA